MTRPIAIAQALAIVSMCSCSNHASTPSATVSGSGSGSVSIDTSASAAPGACEVLPFAASTPLAEASAAAWWGIDGRDQLVVISDSGNTGDYAVVDAETGVTNERGKMPLGEAVTDDLEGLSSRDGKLYGMLAPGWILVWERHGAGFVLVDGPYPLGPVDLPDKGHGDKPPKDDGMVCPGKKNNCGRNYEGLCLVPRAHATGPCTGFAAAKADGRLYCLVDNAGRLQLDRSISIEITKPGALADCAFSDDGRLFAASNLFDTANVYRVDGWQDLAHAKIANLGALGLGFPEVVAVKGDVIYRMSDTGGSPSLMTKFRCTPAKR